MILASFSVMMNKDVIMTADARHQTQVAPMTNGSRKVR